MAGMRGSHLSLLLLGIRESCSIMAGDDIRLAPTVGEITKMSTLSLPFFLRRNVQNMPGILEEPRVKVLGNDVFRMEPAGFVLHHRLLFAIVKGIRSVVSQDLSAELLRSRYTCTGLLPFLSLFACPLATAVGKFVSKHQLFYRETPGSEERTLYEILVSFINR